MSLPIRTIAELGELDHLYQKAATLLTTAHERLKTYDYDLSVRSAQESFELYLKSILAYLGAEYPPTHDQKKEILKLASLLAVVHIQRRDVARLVLANTTLSKWRSPAFYGDETLKVGQVFDEKEAQLAIMYAERASSCAYAVRRAMYEQSSN